MKNFKILWLAVTVAVSLFIVSGKFVDYYRFKFTGAIFEILWLPFLILLFLIPVYSIYQIFRKDTPSKTWFVISLVISLATIGWMVWAG
jgi:hypothetical protein